MKKRFIILIGTLILSLMLSLIGWSYTHDIMTEKMHILVVQKQDDNEKKSTEIARLDNVIQMKNKTIVENKKIIIGKDTKIIKQEKIIKSKDLKIKELNTKLNEKQNKQIQINRNNNHNKTKTVAFVATAYTAYCKGCSGITATGLNARKSIYHKGHRIIAVDPNIIPLNSLVRVNTGQETFTAIASDTGGAIKGYKIDLLVGSSNEAWDFGRKTIGITILKGGK